MMLYTVYTGSKLKGLWSDEEMALRYMATHSPESDSWSLVTIDPNKNLNSKIPAMVKKIKEESIVDAQSRRVHNLKAQSIEAKSKDKVN